MLWIPEFRYWISDILSMEFSLVEFRLQRPRFRIAQAKIYRIQESGLPYMGRKLSSSLFTPSVIRTIAWKKIKKREYRHMPSPYFPQNLHLEFFKANFALLTFKLFVSSIRARTNWVILLQILEPKYGIAFHLKYADSRKLLLDKKIEFCSFISTPNYVDSPTLLNKIAKQQS